MSKRKIQELWSDKVRIRLSPCKFWSVKNVLLFSWVNGNVLWLKLFFSQIKYKEEYEKTKGKAIGTKDSRLLHSLKVAKMSSEVKYLFLLLTWCLFCYFDIFRNLCNQTLTTFTIWNSWKQVTKIDFLSPSVNLQWLEVDLLECSSTEHLGLIRSYP